ncbi:SapC family protein [Alkalilacustris brevis]|uniref:SapC family protein n=1 Tax=Alkalilacustris brevis TaxID=2026338 RepID=UPI000E0D0396|nr:SapC family protein [Alkalilacustris brevis]
MADTSATGWRPAKDMRFAASLEAIALAVAEVPLVAQSVPVAFMHRDAGWRAMAVFSPADGTNRFVTDEGHWRGHYVPSLLRAYPFMLHGEISDRQVKLWPTVRPEPLGEGVEPFMVDGQPTERLQKTMSFLTWAHSEIAKADEAIRIMDDAGALVPWRLPGFEQGLSLGGTALHVADPDNFAALPEPIFMNLRKLGALPWIYSHLHSLHFARIFQEDGETSWPKSLTPLGKKSAAEERKVDALDVLDAIASDLGDFEI